MVWRRWCLAAEHRAGVPEPKPRRSLGSWAMECRNCAAHNIAGGRFCSQCGTPLVSVCGTCGWQGSPGALFCAHCGHELVSRDPVPASGRPDAAGGTDAIDDGARSLRRARPAAELRSASERKQVTVLFADIEGSTAYTANLDPEDVYGVFERCLGRMADAVRGQGGVVAKTMGDGLMALFGAPRSVEDHALRACRAALAMQDAVRVKNERLRKDFGLNLRIRVGLDSGVMVIVKVGEGDNTSYDAAGSTAALAARLEEVARPGAVYLTAATYALARAGIEAKPLPPLAVKGFSAPVTAYELTGVRPVRDRLWSPSGRRFSAFVGRDAELATLRAALNIARGGHGRVVSIVADPGVGKSRLAYEFAQRAAAEGWEVVDCATSPEFVDQPLAPIAALLRSICLIRGDCASGELRARLGQAMARVGQEPSAEAPLLALLNEEPEDSAWHVLEPSAKRRQMTAAFIDLIQAAATRRPTVLLFEDLHWVDSATEQVLDALVTACRHSSIVLVLTQRPEYRNRWFGEEHHRLIDLNTLAPVDAERLLNDLLGSSEGLGDLKRRLIEATGGVPLFLEESVRELIERGALVDDGAGAYRLTAPHFTLSLPPTVQAVLEARIDLLSTIDRQVLQAASVIGPQVDRELLAAVLGRGAEATRRSVDRLHAAQFFAGTTLPASGPLCFKHELTRRVAYSSLLRDQRRDLHRRVYQAVRSDVDESDPQKFAALAHHATHGELWEAAFKYNRLAGIAAHRRWSEGEAIQHFERALAALDRRQKADDGRADDPLTTTRRLDCTLLLCKSLYFAGDFQQSYDRLFAHAEVASHLTDLALRARYRYWMARLASRLGEHTLTIKLAGQSIADGEACGDATTVGKAYAVVCVENLFAGRIDESVDAGRRATEVLSGCDDASALGSAHHCLGLAYNLSGRASEALAVAARTFGIGVAIDDRRLRSYAKYVRGWALSIIGDHQAAVRECEESLELAPDPSSRTFATGYLGQVYVEAGRFARAPDLLREAGTACHAFPALQFASLFDAALSEAWRQIGDMDEAREAALRALRAGGDVRFRYGTGLAERALGRLDLTAGDTTQARKRLERALGHFTRCSAYFERARTHIDLALLEQARGDPRHREKHLTTARYLLRKLNLADRAGQVALLAESLGTAPSR